MRQLDAKPSICPIDEPGAVEAGGGSAAPSIRHSDLLDGDCRSALAEGRTRAAGNGACAAVLAGGRAHVQPKAIAQSATATTRLRKEIGTERRERRAAK
jgi:hypothetical protein